MPVRFRPIIPKEFRGDPFRKAFEEAAEEIRDGMLQDFETTTRTWDHRVEFEADVKVTAGTVTIVAGTDDEIYKYVDEGTREHDIFPVHAPALVFQGVYTAKTIPGVMGSRAGGASGPWQVRKAAHHPGTEPRDFTKIIHDRWEKPVHDAYFDAMVRAAEEAMNG